LSLFIQHCLSSTVYPALFIQHCLSSTVYPAQYIQYSLFRTKAAQFMMNDQTAPGKAPELLFEEPDVNRFRI
jgi:hypothetical protein